MVDFGRSRTGVRLRDLITAATRRRRTARGLDPCVGLARRPRATGSSARVTSTSWCSPIGASCCARPASSPAGRAGGVFERSAARATRRSRSDRHARAAATAARMLARAPAEPPRVDVRGASSPTRPARDRARRGRAPTEARRMSCRDRDRRRHHRRARVRGRRATAVPRARSYREFPQHFPQPGLGRARRRRHLARSRVETLAEVAARARGRRRDGRRDRHHEPARDRRGLGPAHRPARGTARSCGRTGAPRRAATRCAPPATSR